MNDDLTMAVVKAILSGDEYHLEILGVPFGGPNNGRDADKERFTLESNLYLDVYKTIPLVLAHGMDPQTGKPSGKPVYVGTAEYLRTDERGHWFRGVLDKSKKVIAGLWEAAKNGMLAASSGSINHLVRKAKDGTILEWPVAELTLVDLNSNMRPVNSYAVALPMIKAAYREAGIPFPDATLGSDDGGLPEADEAAKRARTRAVKTHSKAILAKTKKYLED
jgi:hypothetical protein